MAALDFPESPTIGEIFSSAKKQWIWSGSVWELAGTAGGGGIEWEAISANTTAESNTGYIVSTENGPVTLLLPSSPTTGDNVVVTDSKDTFSNNALTVGSSSDVINESSGPLLVNVNGATVSLLYIDSTTGWKVV